MLTVHHLRISQSERIVWLCEELADADRKNKPHFPSREGIDFEHQRVWTARPEAVDVGHLVNG